MKKLLVFLSIFAFLFSSLNLTPNFKNNAEAVDSTFPNFGSILNVYSVYSDISVISVASPNTTPLFDQISLGASYFMPGDVSSYFTGVRYEGPSPTSYVNVTYTHNEDTSLPPNNPPDTFTSIEYSSNDTSGLLYVYFNDFYFSDDIDPLYYGQIWMNSADPWNAQVLIDYTYIDGYGSLVDDQSIIDIITQPINIPILFGDLLTSITNDVVYVRSMVFYYDTFSNANSSLDFDFILKTKRLDFTDSAYLGNPLYNDLQNEFVSQREIEITTPFDWMTNALDSFVNLEIFPNFSISSVLGIVFGFCFLLIIIKIFFGG